MQYHEAFRRAASLDIVLETYRVNMGTAADMHAAMLGRITSNHVDTLRRHTPLPRKDSNEDMTERERLLARWHQTDAVLQPTAFAVLGALEPTAPLVKDLSAIASRALLRHMSHADRDLVHETRSLLNSEDSASEQAKAFLEAAQPDSALAVAAALDVTRYTQLDRLAAVPSGVRGETFAAGREQLSPLGKTAIWSALDRHILTEVQRQLGAQGVTALGIQEAASQATEPAQLAIRAALDKDVWLAMQDSHLHQGADNPLLDELMALASSTEVGSLLRERLNDPPNNTHLQIETPHP